MFHGVGDHSLPARVGRGPRLKQQSIRGVLRLHTVGIEVQVKRLRHPGKIRSRLGEPQVAGAVAIEVDPGVFERLITLRHDRHLRALDGADIALPGHGLGRPACVGRECVADLAHEQRR